VWEFYDAFKKVHIPEKRIERWVIIDEKPGEIIKKSLIISNFSEFGVYNNKTKVEMKKDNIEANQFPKRETFLEAQKKEKRSSPVRPIDLLISGESIHVSKVREVLIRTAEWLITKEKLKLTDVPIESGPIRYIINDKPIHKNGASFFDSYTLSNGLFLEVHGSHMAIENNALVLMRHFGFNDNSIKVKWSNNKQ
jgi:hypothetical protein